VLKELRRESFVIHYGRHDTYYREQVSEDIAVLYNPAPRQLEMFYQLVNRNKPVIVKENDFFLSVLGEDYPLFVNDPTEMKEKVLQLAKNEDLYASVAEAGIKTLQQEE